MVAFVIAITFFPPIQSFLSTTALTNLQWIMVITGAIAASSWIEVVKWIRIQSSLVNLVN